MDLKQGVLRIMESKFGKDRLVPMTNSLNSECRKYSETYLQGADSTVFFFSPDKLHAYSTQTIYGRFRDLLFSAGIPHRGKGLGPRLHDLRHTFAVHSLRQLAANGMDLYVGLPILSAQILICGQKIQCRQHGILTVKTFLDSSLEHSLCAFPLNSINFISLSSLIYLVNVF